MSGTTDIIDQKWKNLPGPVSKGLQSLIWALLLARMRVLQAVRLLSGIGLSSIGPPKEEIASEKGKFVFFLSPFSRRLVFWTRSSFPLKSLVFGGVCGVDLLQCIVVAFLLLSDMCFMVKQQAKSASKSQFLTVDLGDTLASMLPDLLWIMVARLLPQSRENP